MPRKKNPVPIKTCTNHGPCIRVVYTGDECSVCVRIAELAKKAERWDALVATAMDKPPQPAPKHTRKKKEKAGATSDAPSVSPLVVLMCPHCKTGYTEPKMRGNVETCPNCGEPLNI